MSDGFTVTVINADGTGSQLIANYSYPPSESPFGGWYAEWSPDGTWLAFLRGGRFTVMKADGSIHYDLDYNGFPRWSPDGRFLTFADYYDDTSDIYIMSLAR
jgi:Tol biopolymer transport system component